MSENCRFRVRAMLVSEHEPHQQATYDCDLTAQTRLLNHLLQLLLQLRLSALLRPCRLRNRSRTVAAFRRVIVPSTSSSSSVSSLSCGET